ncbi:hypothetical protein NKR23_g7212 [Pleurostoma richardsiae]|uniref:Uncharacterized protein n=1 Tax=Pleurostoma richardsiae TaxID=41990 RepID=A0AA38VDJ3_9PEZI|nr:hypothetical protein NKR23_g7212 [Pleurostoma richardsiae]
MASTAGDIVASDYTASIAKLLDTPTPHQVTVPFIVNGFAQNATLPATDALSFIIVQLMGFCSLPANLQKPYLSMLGNLSVDCSTSIPVPPVHVHAVACDNCLIAAHIAILVLYVIAGIEVSSCVFPYGITIPSSLSAHILKPPFKAMFKAAGLLFMTLFWPILLVYHSFWMLVVTAWAHVFIRARTPTTIAACNSAERFLLWTGLSSKQWFAIRTAVGRRRNKRITEETAQKNVAYMTEPATEAASPPRTEDGHGCEACQKHRNIEYRKGLSLGGQQEEHTGSVSQHDEWFCVSEK